jgi:large subunit ribosomal protein L21e
MPHQKHKGKRHKTRQKLRKHKREKGMPTVNTLLREYKEGDRVHIEINPSIHSAMPHRRFHGRTGTVQGRRGDCYLVKVKNMNALRTIIVHPAHIKLQVIVAKAV